MDEMYEICSYSPILVDVAGNGFSLTDGPNGVIFDVQPGGKPELVSWTQAAADDAWLALDRDGNGTIDNGAELFGNFTPQPSGKAPNGFKALAVFDTNADQWINSSDEVYGRLRLWHDANHDGVSQPEELKALAAQGLLRISLDYKSSEKQDRFQNEYRFRAKIVSEHPRDLGPYAYDVYLSVVHAQAAASEKR
jgi:hypothetical protein